MLPRLRFLVVHFAYWVAFFVVARLVFLAYHAPLAARLGTRTLLGTVGHGLRMDCAVAAYASAVPCVLTALSALAPHVPLRAVRATIAGFAMALAVAMSILVAGDLELFSAWGYRVDATALKYLTTPREMAASVGSSPILLLVAILVALAAAALYALRRLVLPAMRDWEVLAPRRRAPALLALLLVTAALVVPIRGGVQLAPLNASAVYFSRRPFANQAALDPAWTFFNSAFDRRRETRNRYAFLAPARADSIVRSLYPPPGGAPPARLLRLARPNVLVIIWESFTAKAVASLGGAPGVTPRFDSLVREGVLFDHTYAPGDRTDKGIVAVLSGFPAQPKTDLIKQPNKTARLPALSRDLAAAGYRTTFVYGGELEFANIRSYLVNAGFDSLVGKADFPPAQWNSKWGAHDHVVLDRVLRTLAAERRPFFTTVLTLSSHEPFEVPPEVMAPRFPGSDEPSLFLSSLAYTDRALGDFVRRAQREPWWDSTLVVILGDHGHRLPVIHPGLGTATADEYHTPMLWLGGALAVRDTVISRVASQVDLAPTLLGQLGLPGAAYHWGHDLLRPDAPAFAFFIVPDGVGTVTPRGSVVYDFIAQRPVYRTGTATDADARAGVACVQKVVDDYLRL